VLSIDEASNDYIVNIKTSNRNYRIAFDPGGFDLDPTEWVFTLSVIADMDSNDTSTVTISQATGTAQTDIDVQTYWSGALLF